MDPKLRHLRQLVGTVFDLHAAAKVLSWDQQTYMPPGGAQVRASQLATLSQLAHEKFTSDEFGAALEAARSAVQELDPDSDDARLVRWLDREYDKQRKVPFEWVGAFHHTTSLADQAWKAARAASDFLQFKPHLEKIVKLRREYAEFFAPYEHVYDPQLDNFERGMSTAEVKAVFEALRPKQVRLVGAITERADSVDDSVLHQPFDVGKQWAFGLEVIKAFGYDFDRGRQDQSAHPFTTLFSIGDVRITTRMDPNYLGSGLFSTLHEAGHGLYFQGVSSSLDRTQLTEGASHGIHESQSRLWENLVGRSRSFWRAYYPRLQETFPAQLGDVELETFYRAINKVEPSLIRVEADEATYNLHIMLRFELEIALMEGTLTVADLPAAWNSKMEEYLGLTPPDDASGVLQDIHWSDGSFGYFPSYAIGNLVASQLWEKIEADIPDLDRQLERGAFGDLLSWLRDNIHQHGAKFEPVELVERATGQALTPEPYLRYLQEKLGEIYALA
jgi:carboxypeptidase Taq